MKNLFAAILSIFLLQVVLAQTPALNAVRYETYRQRLLQEFMIDVGPGAGKSIPASIRNTISGEIKWGDATIDLAYYMGVLATEYYLKQQSGSNLDSTIKELFYALNALNRLDYTAEVYFGGAPSLNGFFIRDDITADSLNLPQVLSHLNQNSSSFIITQLSSDLSASDPTLKEMSLDQVIHLLAGLSLVIKFIPDTTVYYENNSAKQFHDFETSVRQEAKNIIKRLVNYMKEGNPVVVNLSPFDTNLYGIQGNNWDFNIKNPVTGMLVARGPYAAGLAIGYAGTKYRFTGANSFTVMDTLHQQSLAVFTWLQDNILPNNQDDKAILLNALCNCWPSGDYTTNSTLNYNGEKIGSRSFEQSYDYIPLLHNVLFEQPNYLLSMVQVTHPYYNNIQGYYSALLDSAPAIGPFNYGNGNYGNWQWSSTSRNIHPIRRGDSIPDFPGNYNGLDYMLIYNLHQISNAIVINVAEQLLKKSTLYPNPCSSRLIIPLPVNQKSNIIIYSLEGKEIFNVNNITSNYNLNCDEFLPGLYILKIINGEKTETHKLFFNTK